MDRKNRAQAKRELAASHSSAETLALGTAAGSMILGALLRPAQADERRDGAEHGAALSSAAEQGHDHAEHQAMTPPDQQAAHGAYPATGHSADAARSSAPTGAADHAMSDHFPAADAASTGVVNHLAGGLNGSLDTDHHSGTETAAPPAPMFDHSASSASSHDAAFPSALSDASGAHSLTAVGGVFDQIGTTLHEMASALTHSMSDAVSSLASAITTVTSTLTAPFIGGDSPVETLLHDQVLSSVETVLHDAMAPITDVLHAVVTPVPSAVPDAAAPVQSVLQSFDQPLASAAGAVGDLSHAAIGSYGDLASSLHIGFIGQPIAQAAGGHDLGAVHDAGSSILHGFL